MDARQRRGGRVGSAPRLCEKVLSILEGREARSIRKRRARPELHPLAGSARFQAIQWHSNKVEFSENRSPLHHRCVSRHTSGEAFETLRKAAISAKSAPEQNPGATAVILCPLFGTRLPFFGGRTPLDSALVGLCEWPIAVY